CCLSVGVDPLIGLLPVVGDFAGVFLSAMLLYSAMQAWQLPSSLVSQMVLNIIIDALAGFVPIIGDLADFLFKCNLRNCDLLEAHLAAK
ncbi:hypothetical protein SYNPS1DRAFT_7246, partial [Syncephalis pseudoplumigaleata]